MKKSPRAPRKEFTDLQKAHKEIKSLKKQIGRMKKFISRIDKYHHDRVFFDDVVDEPVENKKQSKNTDIDKWLCFACGDGQLMLVVYPRVDVLHYFRRCNNCGHRTKSQQFDESVEGLKEDEI